MIRIGVCDDMEEEICRQKSILLRIAEKLDLEMEIRDFWSGEELLEEIENYGSFDIILLDIEMEGKDGIETARCIREKDFSTIVIFVSAHEQYCRKMLEVQPFAFLEKPVSEAALEDVLKKALRTRCPENERFLFSNQKHRYSVPIHQIMYFESIGRQICVHGTEHVYYFYGKLSAVEKETSGLHVRFARAQVSYLVNLRFVREWNYDKLKMDDGAEIPVSKKYRQDMRRHYMGMLENT